MIKYHVFSMEMRPTGRCPRKAYAKCVPNETVSHKKLVKEVTEHLRFFPHGMMEAVLEEVFNRLSEHLGPRRPESPWTASEHSVSPLKCEASRFGLCSPRKTSRRAHRVCPVSQTQGRHLQIWNINDSTNLLTSWNLYYSSI